MFSEDLSELDDSRSVSGYIATVGGCHVLLSMQFFSGKSFIKCKVVGGMLLQKSIS